MDFALIKELLTNLVSAQKILGIEEEKLSTWQEMLGKIPAYRTNADGAIQEWLHEDFLDNYHHRHQSHIYPLFPGLEVTEESDGELFAAIKTAVDKRLSEGIKEQTGWSFAHMANIFARLSNAEKAKECLDLLIRFCTGSNLFTYHNDWRNMGVTLKYMVCKQAPFQIDANMGFTSAVYEMLLYSNLKMIKILPAIPKQFKSGCVKGMIARGGFTVDIAWTEKDVEVSITSREDRCVDIGMKNAVLTLCTASYKESQFGNGFACVELGKGQAVRLNYSRIDTKN